ncbi:MAG: hypothetical protein NTV33_04460 [Coprothermobacterota bacterium]|nr:hypothetical protein [Coprothermobacterota bacterium]
MEGLEAFFERALRLDSPQQRVTEHPAGGCSVMHCDTEATRQKEEDYSPPGKADGTRSGLSPRDGPDPRFAALGRRSPTADKTT